MHQLLNGRKAFLPVVGVALMTLMGSANAAEAAFAAALADITGNVTTFAGGLVTLAVVGVAFMVAIKYVKKLRGAA